MIPMIVKLFSDPSVFRKGFLYVWNLLMNEFRQYSMIVSILSSALFVVAAAIIFTVRQNRRDKLGVVPKKNYFREVGFTKAPLSVCAVSVVFGAALNRIVTYIVNFIPWPDFFVNSFKWTYGQLSDDGNPLYIVILCTVVMAPIAEEFLFRGIACSRLSPAFPRAAVVVFSSLVFGIVHGTPIAMIYASAFGVVQAFVFLRHRSLYPVMLSHLAFNLTAVVFDEACGVPTLDLFIFFTCAAVSVAGIWFVTRKKKEVFPEAYEI